MENRIKKIMEDIFKVTIDDHFSKASTDDWDSFTHLDLIVRLENEFNISFTPNEIGKIESYNDIIEILNEKIQ